MLSGSGYAKTQGEILAEALSLIGYKVTTKSSFVNRVIRFIDTIFYLLIRRRNYDIVIIQIYGGLSFVLEDIASAIARFHKKKIIMTLHGGALPSFLIDKQTWGRRVFSRATYITSPSSYLIDNLSFLSLKMIEIPNIIDLKDYQFKDRISFDPKLFWMRAYHEIYNPLLALEVFDRLCVVYPNAKLTMAGPDMGLLNEVKKRAAVSKNYDNIEILNIIDLGMKQHIAANHDIYLNTNLIDNTPVSMIEMAAFGLPLVSTNVGGIPYLFENGRSALLGHSQDPDDLAKCATQIIDNPELGKGLVREARKIAEKFDWSNVQVKWNKILTL
ncbi:MAG: glycosyltransferase family 4 protein [Cyclobacteriaceae bacterium]